MRYFLMLLACTPLLAIAAPYGGAEGKNQLGEIIGISSEVPEIYVHKNIKDSEVNERYNLSEECPTFLKGDFKKFSCKSNRKSPLAGTTYKVITSKKYHPCDDHTFNGTIYVCIKGCNNKRAPKIFYESPYEC